MDVLQQRGNPLEILKHYRTAYQLFVFLCLLSTQASAEDITLDFVGTVTAVGQLTGTTTPSGYDLSDYTAGDPVIGYVTFKNTPSSWENILFDIAGTRSVWRHLPPPSPLPADFLLQFPLSGVTISPANTPHQLQADFDALNNGINEALKVKLSHPSTSGLEFNFQFFGSNGSAGALDSYRPSVVDLNAFASRSISFGVQVRSGFNIVGDLAVNTTFEAPPSVIDPFGSLFSGFGAFEAITSSGAIAGWNVLGPGTATLQALADGTRAVQLTAGSPVSISQFIDTPTEAFDLLFDYEFLTTSGAIEVLLDGQLLGEISAPDSLAGAFASAMLAVNNPALLGKSGLELIFRFDGITGSQVLLDNVSAATVVPLPATFWLLAPILGLLAATKRSKTSAAV